jgi:hypothetical protein
VTEVGKLLESDPVGVMRELSRRHQGGAAAGDPTGAGDVDAYNRVMRALLDPPTAASTRNIQTAMLTTLADIREKKEVGDRDGAEKSAYLFGDLMGGMDNALRAANLDQNAQVDFMVGMFSGTFALAGRPFGPLGAGIAGAASQVAETIGDWAREKNKLGSDQIMAAMYALANSVDIGEHATRAMQHSWAHMAPADENGNTAPRRASKLAASSNSLAQKLARKGLMSLSELGKSYARQGGEAVLSDT